MGGLADGVDGLALGKRPADERSREVPSAAQGELQSEDVGLLGSAQGEGQELALGPGQLVAAPIPASLGRASRGGRCARDPTLLPTWRFLLEWVFGLGFWCKFGNSNGLLATRARKPERRAPRAQESQWPLRAGAQPGWRRAALYPRARRHGVSPPRRGLSCPRWCCSPCARARAAPGRAPCTSCRRRVASRRPPRGQCWEGRRPRSLARAPA